MIFITQNDNLNEYLYILIIQEKNWGIKIFKEDNVDRKGERESEIEKKKHK